ncbi:hypothetical protein VaNZ11_012600, partial [Volvox africanus]
CPQDASSSQAVHRSAWNQRETDSHMSVLARSQWFCSLVQDALPDLSVDTASGELCWQGVPLTSTPVLDRYMAAAVCAVCLAAREQVTILAKPNLSPSQPSWSASPPTQKTVQLLSALQEALLLRLLPNLVACKAPLAGRAAAAAGGGSYLGQSTALEAVPCVTSAPGGGGNRAAGLLMNAHPAAALLCCAVADLAVAASESVAGAPYLSTTGGPANRDNHPNRVPRAADNAPGDGRVGDEPLKRLVTLCCEALAGFAEIEKEAEAGARGSGSGLSVGQVAASHTLRTVCVALASDLGACGDGEVRQKMDGETCGEGMRSGKPGSGGVAGVLQMMLDVVCAAPQRLGTVLRQHLHALLLPALLGACAVQMSPENYAAAAARCIATMRGDSPTNLRNQTCTATAVLPPSLTVTSAVREAVATLAGLDARHVAAADWPLGCFPPCSPRRCWPRGIGQPGSGR